MIDGFQILFICFAKAYTRIQHDLFIRNTCFVCDSDAFFHIGDHFFQKILIYGFVSVVHQTAGSVVTGGYLGGFIVELESPDIIDQVGTGLKGSLCDISFVSIDGNRNIKM